MAHELGHALLESTGPRCPQTGDVVERICDQISAEFLLPAYGLKVTYRHQRPFIEMIRDICRRYEVSRGAAVRRIAELWGVGVFEVAKGEITWKRGIAVQQWAGADQTLRESIERAMSAEDGADTIAFYSGASWTSKRVEWEAATKGRSAYFLLT